MSKYIITFLVFSLSSYLYVSSLVSTPALASVQTPLESRLIQQINRTSGVSLARQTFSNLQFKKRRDANLYLTLFNEYSVRSRENALRATAAYEGLRQHQVENILFRGETPEQTSEDATQLSSRDQSVRLTFNFEREMFRDLTYLQMNTLAFEMFANGTRSDSGFDLLHDLDEIEKLLFAERTPSQFDGSINLDQSSAKSATSQNFQPVPFQSQNDTSVDSSEDDDDAPSAVSPSTSDEDVLQDELPPNSLVCPANQSLQDAINQFEENQSNQIGQTLTTPDGQQVQLGIGADFASFSQQAGFSRPNLKAFTPANPRCNAGGIFTDYLVFCLRTEVVRTQARSYFPDTQDCVACEIQKIAKIVDDIHADSLVPQKITGNMAEPAICKNYAFSLFSMNINIIAAPARADLEVLPLVQDMTVENITRREIEPVQAPSVEEAVSIATQVLSSAASIAIADAAELGSEVTAQDDLIRQLAATNSIRVDTFGTFENQLSQRLTNFSQNFSLMLDQISQVNSALIQVNQKGVCR